MPDRVVPSFERHSRGGVVHIGVSGWTYPPWRGNFYPAGLRQADELAFASRSFSALEVNGTFYGLQVPGTFQQWRAVTPDRFVFAVKGSRFITHFLKLRGIETALANFFASGVLALGEKLGPLLWQFPPNFAYEPERLDAFFRLLPRDGAQAAGAICVALSGAGPGVIAFAREGYDRIGRAMKTGFAEAGLKSRYWILDATAEGARIGRLPV